MGKNRNQRPGRRRRNTRNRATATVHEWVGGRIVTPFYITEDDPYRPEMILWMELPDGLVVGSRLIDPAGPPVSFAESVPALAGKTPRQATRTKSDRERLELLIKEHENGEARLPQEERFDFSRLRAELGLTT